MIYLSVAFSILSTVLLMLLVWVLWLPYRKSVDLACAPWIFAWLAVGLVWNFFSGNVPVVLKYLAGAVPQGPSLVEIISVCLVFTFSLSSFLLGFMIACNAASLLADRAKDSGIVQFLKRCHTWQPIYGGVLIVLKLAPAIVFLLPQVFRKS